MKLSTVTIFKMYLGATLVHKAYLGTAIAVNNQTLDFSKPENSQYIALAFQEI